MRPTGIEGFGERLKSERKMRGFTLQAFVKETGIAMSQITGFENRGIVPRPENLISIACVLDCSTDYLLGIEDENGKSLRK